MTLPSGMVPYGPDHPDYPNEPRDWDCALVMRRDGQVTSPGTTNAWNHGRAGVPEYDVVGYTPQAQAATPSADRDQGLEVAIVDGQLVISIGIDALLVAAQGSPAWEEQEAEERGYAIDSVDGFANDILWQLVEEEEDGTTLVHVAIDTAVERALDAGSLHINYGTDA